MGPDVRLNGHRLNSQQLSEPWEVRLSFQPSGNPKLELALKGEKVELNIQAMPLTITQAPQEPIQVRQPFVVAGTASPTDAGKVLILTIDQQFKAKGPPVGADGSWQLNFSFQQTGIRLMEIAIAGDKVDLKIQVVPTHPPTSLPSRIQITSVPESIRAEQDVVLAGTADHYANGDQLVIKADQLYELARIEACEGQWQATVVFRQAGRRLVEVMGSEQDRAVIHLDVLPNNAMPMVPRSIWTTQPTPADLPLLEPKGITLHHTFVSPTLPVTASQAEEVERMRQIWRIHTQGNGWSDIGYHFVIMPSGRIYEARSERKRGAHDVINDGLGIAFDGVYTQETITQAQFQSAIVLCTLLCQRYNIIDPVTPVPTTTYDYGTRNLPRILGHRDRVNTECPGTEGGESVRLHEIRLAVLQRL